MAEKNLSEELNKLTETFTELVVDSMKSAMPEKRQRSVAGRP